MVASWFAIASFLAALGCGIMGGVFFVFSTSIMTALGRLPPEQGIAAMQSVNIAVINPLFMAALFGTALLCVVLAAGSYMRWNEAGTGYVLAASLAYLIGAILATMIFNVPLNNALASADPASAQAAELWARYLGQWTAWNHVRTFASLAASAGFIMAFRAMR
jgi:uncharacterized membrane protein